MNLPAEVSFTGCLQWPWPIELICEYRQLCLTRTCVIRIFVYTGQIGRSQSLPIHIIPICIIQNVPNPDGHLWSTSVRIKQSCLYMVILKGLLQSLNPIASWKYQLWLPRPPLSWVRKQRSQNLSYTQAWEDFDSFFLIKFYQNMYALLGIKCLQIWSHLA